MWNDFLSLYLRVPGLGGGGFGQVNLDLDPEGPENAGSINIDTHSLVSLQSCNVNARGCFLSLFSCELCSDNTRVVS
jgi:hypothetical protein